MLVLIGLLCPSIAPLPDATPPVRLRTFALVVTRLSRQALATLASPMASRSLHRARPWPSSQRSQTKPTTLPRRGAVCRVALEKRQFETPPGGTLAGTMTGNNGGIPPPGTTRPLNRAPPDGLRRHDRLRRLQERRAVPAPTRRGL